ncbi:MAG: ChaB family protein [Bacteroidetes bacterium]|jgi:cation transport regulator|nr:ChaB family protein [Bacteroidota bacterium]
MPYNKITELPKQVKDALPAHGQEIYQAAYNNAWQEYKNPQDREESNSREETAHKVAWAAVKNVYHKNKFGEWTR